MNKKIEIDEEPDEADWKELHEERYLPSRLIKGGNK